MWTRKEGWNHRNYTHTCSDWQRYVKCGKSHALCRRQLATCLHFRQLRPASYRARPPLWSNGRSSCLQIHRSGFDSRRYQIFWEVMALERGPLSLEKKSSDSGLRNREYGRRDKLCWPHKTLYQRKLTLHFTDNLQSLGRYSSDATKGHGVLFVCLFV
jgi:hypothetical protein